MNSIFLLYINKPKTSMEREIPLLFILKFN